LSALVAVLSLALVALLGARFGFRREGAPRELRLFLASGSHYLLIGFLLGPAAAGLLTPEILDGLSPLVALGLGWVGLLFGLQFDRASLERFGLTEHLAATLQAVLAFAVLAVGGWLLLRLTGTEGALGWALVGAAAAAGCASTPTGLAILTDRTVTGGPPFRLLSLATSLDAGVGFLALAAVLAVFHPPSLFADVPLAPARWLGLTVLLGVFFGWFFVALTREHTDAEEFVLFLIGLALLAAGSHAYFSVSALLGCAVTGAVVANAAPARARAYDVLSSWEQPVHVVFLVISGALLRFTGWELVPLVGAYVALRALGKMAGGWVAARALPEPRPDFGAGLLAQGGLSVAMAVSVHQLASHAYPGSPLPDLFFATVVLGVAAWELAGPPLLRRVLGGSPGETGEVEAPAVEDVLEESARR